MRGTGTRDVDGYWPQRITADHRLVDALLDRGDLGRRLPESVRPVTSRLSCRAHRMLRVT
jgi:hypothetical protein